VAFSFDFKTQGYAVSVEMGVTIVLGGVMQTLILVRIILVWPIRHTGCIFQLLVLVVLNCDLICTCTVIFDQLSTDD